MTLLSMKDSTSSAGKPLLCEHCDSGDSALSRCTDCCVFMCEFCVTAHKRINATKGHKILTLDEVKRLGSKALVKPAFCRKHTGETLKLFCQTCQKTICRDCTIVDHRDHMYDFVADVAEREREVIQALLLETKAKDRFLEEGLKAVQTMESCVQAKITEVNKEVDVFFDEQVKTLEYMRGNLKHEVTTQGQIKLKQLGSQKEELSLTLAQLRSSVNFAEHALVDGDDIELLSMKEQVVKRLAHLNISQVQCKPCKTDYLKLRVEKTIWDIGKMATLDYIPTDPTKCVLSMVGGEEGVMYQTLAGQSVDFILVIRDEKAAKKVQVRALVNHEGAEATIQEDLLVQDNGDKSYIFSYCPETDGLCTLSVMVEGENAHGSPFTWKVKPKVHFLELLSFQASGEEQYLAQTEKHCWKIKVDFFGVRNYEIGVSCLKQAELEFNVNCDVEVKRSSWCYKFGKRGKGQFSRSDNPRAAAINSLRHGDVFSVFLNFDTKKLVIYNARSKQTEVFRDAFEGDKVVPIISPYVQNIQNSVSGLSLDT